jgi:hypothetical protein
MIIVAMVGSALAAILILMNGGFLPAIITDQKKTEHCRTYIQHLQDEEGNGKIITECSAD